MSYPTADLGHELQLRLHRSELLSLCLEAEKQSARHQKASADAASETSRCVGVLSAGKLSRALLVPRNLQSGEAFPSAGSEPINEMA